MTTQASAVLGHYQALIKDVLTVVPELQQPLERDSFLLRDRVEARGVRVVMIDFPAFGKLFDKGLSSGRLRYDLIPHTLGAWEKGTVLFQSLFNQVFDPSGLLQEADPDLVFFSRTFLYMCKRVEIKCSDSAVSGSVSDFVTTDGGLRPPTRLWEASRDFPAVSGGVTFEAPVADYQYSRLQQQLMAMLQVVADHLCPKAKLEPMDIVPRHGPGVVADLPKGADKYVPIWPERLETLFPAAYFLSPRGDSQVRREPMLGGRAMEAASKLIAVPKTLKAPRLIAAEPAANQFLQQGLMTWLRENMPGPIAHCYNYNSQEPSREAALAASRSGEEATVDLSAASDRLSCWTVERAFRRNESLLQALWSTRTHHVFDGIGCQGWNELVGEGNTLPLRKFAAMGSAVTFPVQSMIYSTCAITATIAATIGTRESRVKKRDIWCAARRVRVFGDDLIVPTDAVWYLGEIFRCLQLKINGEKTHTTGSFRESCGMDGFEGHNVTPFYLTQFSPNYRRTGNLPAWVDVCNNAHTCGLWHLADHMVSLLPKKVRRLIPVSKEPQECLRLTTFMSGHHRVASRFNLNLQLPEVRGLTPIVKKELGSRESDLNLLQYFVEAPDPQTKWEAGYQIRNRSEVVPRWVVLR